MTVGAVDELERVLHLEAPFVVHFDLADFSTGLPSSAREIEKPPRSFIFAAGVLGRDDPRSAGFLLSRWRPRGRGFARDAQPPAVSAATSRRIRQSPCSRARQSRARASASWRALVVRFIGVRASLRRRLTWPAPDRLRRAPRDRVLRLEESRSRRYRTRCEWRRKSAMLKSSSDLPAAAVSRTSAPTISCAWRNATPRLDQVLREIGRQRKSTGRRAHALRR